MRRTFDIPAGDLAPAADAVFAHLGIPPAADPGERARAVLDACRRELADVARPAGVFQTVGVEEFADIHAGRGENAPQTPLQSIYPRAASLALFAVTLGSGVGARIRAHFEADRFAEGTILDALASEAVEQAGDTAQSRFTTALEPAPGEPVGVLRYSPGYCGWHLSGQRSLFGSLRPEEIGITLRESFLMEPLKSMSGVIVAGAPDIHRFVPGFPFCATCRNRGCHARMDEAAHVETERGR